MSSRGEAVGILAYGSLGEDPGGEIGPFVVEKVENVETPFRVEFARRSGMTRCGAPTLVPVSEGGAQVKAKILVLEDVSEVEATDMLWRRETWRVGSEQRYDPSSEVKVRRLEDFEGLDLVLYVEIESNIPDPNPHKLAELAIRSARSEAGRRGKDGIAYLIEVKENGVETTLMPEYEREILRLAGTDTLERARERFMMQ